MKELEKELGEELDKLIGLILSKLEREKEGKSIDDFMNKVSAILGAITILKDLLEDDYCSALSDLRLVEELLKDVCIDDVSS